MANPQLENGHTQIANEILEHLIKLHLSSNQWQVLLCIIRKTYGFHKKVDYIANKQIVEATGLCKAVVSRSLAKLEKMAVITRTGNALPDPSAFSRVTRKLLRVIRKRCQWEDD